MTKNTKEKTSKKQATNGKSKEGTPAKNKISTTKNKKKQVANQSKSPPVTAQSSQVFKPLTPVLPSKLGKSEQKLHEDNDGTIDGKYNVSLLKKFVSLLKKFVKEKKEFKIDVEGSHMQKKWNIQHTFQERNQLC